MTEQNNPRPFLSQTNHSLARIILFSFLLTFIDFAHKIIGPKLYQIEAASPP
jgi:hypothetical protein